MGRLKFYFSIFLARCIALLIKLIGRSGGTSFVGLFTLKFNPDFLNYCSKYILGKKISITGTNGKTTTAGLLAHVFEANGKTIIHNSQGANMLTGIANVFATTIVPSKRYDNCVLESDEAYLSKLYDYITLDYLVVTNLFRDQLDRYGELDTTAKKIQSAIDKNNNLILILNADDPLVANLGKSNKRIYYGFEDIEFTGKRTTSQAPAETFNCVCGNTLEYSKRFYAQQGHYYCTCGYKRPECDYKGYAKISDDFIEITVKHNDQTTNYTVNTIGLYNAYNVLAAIATALESGYNQEQIQHSLDTYKAMFGRAEKTEINGHKTIIQLIKNPAGASEVLKTVDLNSNILIAINDNFADGRDVSWLWDSEFELLKDTQKTIITSGIRANDMALRLKYAGIPTDKIKVIPDLFKAIDEVSKSDNKNERITIMPSYTALLQIKNAGKNNAS
ncbi:MAG: MurT ligase domain-containing protein [Candidatus Gastranaerophilaceae bacterium]